LQLPDKSSGHVKYPKDWFSRICRAGGTVQSDLLTKKSLECSCNPIFREDDADYDNTGHFKSPVSDTESCEKEALIWGQLEKVVSEHTEPHDSLRLRQSLPLSEDEAADREIGTEGLLKPHQAQQGSYFLGRLR
jgi:hypothetical protein